MLVQQYFGTYRREKNWGEVGRKEEWLKSTGLIRSNCSSTVGGGGGGALQINRARIAVIQLFLRHSSPDLKSTQHTIEPLAVCLFPFHSLCLLTPASPDTQRWRRYFIHLCVIIIIINPGLCVYVSVRCIRAWVYGWVYVCVCVRMNLPLLFPVTHSRHVNTHAERWEDVV